MCGVQQSGGQSVGSSSTHLACAFDWGLPFFFRPNVFTPSRAQRLLARWALRRLLRRSPRLHPSRAVAGPCGMRLAPSRFEQLRLHRFRASASARPKNSAAWQAARPEMEPALCRRQEGYPASRSRPAKLLSSARKPSSGPRRLPSGGWRGERGRPAMAVAQGASRRAGGCVPSSSPQRGRRAVLPRRCRPRDGTRSARFPRRSARPGRSALISSRSQRDRLAPRAGSGTRPRRRAPAGGPRGNTSAPSAPGSAEVPQPGAGKQRAQPHGLAAKAGADRLPRAVVALAEEQVERALTRTPALSRSAPAGHLVEHPARTSVRLPARSAFHRCLGHQQRGRDPPLPNPQSSFSTRRAGIAETGWAHSRKNIMRSWSSSNSLSWNIGSRSG